MTTMQIYAGGAAFTALLFLWAAMIATPADLKRMTTRGASYAVVFWPITLTVLFVKLAIGRRT